MAGSSPSTRQLGKYQLIAELGRGGMADVFLAMTRSEELAFSKLVVIKMVREHLAHDADFITMLADEARISARLNHPNLVQTMEVGQVDGQYFLTMEYLDGQPLHRILNRSRPTFPLSMHLSILVDVLAGIHYAHELKDFDGTSLRIVHRDVTPSNCFVTYQGQVKVVDFGIAKAVGRVGETRHGVLKGKAAYMAPEQVTGGVVDRRVDIFAVGVMLYEALTRRRMWSGVSETQILRMLIAGTLPSSPRAIDPSIDAQLERICTRALAYDASDRYSTAAEMQRDLESYLDAHDSRPTSRELGAFVSKLFADRRAATDKTIERLTRADAQAAGPRPALESRDKVSSSSVAGAVRAPSGGSSAARSSSVDRPTRRLAILLPLSAVAVAVALALVMLWRVTAGAHAESRITVTLRATPLETRFSIDEGPILENPFIGQFPIDDRLHRIRAFAADYPDKEEMARFNQDVSIRFALTPSRR